MPARIHRLFLTALSVATLCVHPAQSQSAMRVLELFTSEACRACLRADALLDREARMPRTVAIAWHVDYWNMRGWSDPLSQPAASQRQYGYRDAFGLTGVFTPQVVVNGVASMAAGKRSLVEEALPQSDVATLPIKVERLPDSVMIGLPERADMSGDVRVLLLLTRPDRLRYISGGDNAGRSSLSVNVVAELRTLQRWRGEAQQIELPRSDIEVHGGDSFLLIQRFDGLGRPRAIIGAERLLGEKIVSG
ncbi:DUF1223 domain-containing protein [Notoacmeibacter sp. MSK16QG-6]|uniref:DUF1223 domain-containing protein n=1 Tax=Notoacmeibacter sp. MSK16QG-6 TaxID=2957982 RepID=UPI00209EB5E3|nr:DUF1223 domain-containing protein [Notoacmeibacter sp. MSK16QG-6]MCP1199138.1 DUF1223 domain-containing protein [Notoacmeibacter sp. MSK16QG-6]